MATQSKRPLLTPVDRARIRQLAAKAEKRAESSMNRAYCKGVQDVLAWLDNAEMTPMLREVVQ